MKCFFVCLVFAATLFNAAQAKAPYVMAAHLGHPT
jgi:hypothetical protein